MDVGRKFALETLAVHAGQEKPEVLCPAASICPPVLTREHAIYGGLDGKLYVVPLAGGEPWSLGAAFGAAITAPVAVAGGRIYVACEDGYWDRTARRPCRRKTWKSGRSAAR